MWRGPCRPSRCPLGEYRGPRSTGTGRVGNFTVNTPDERIPLVNRPALGPTVNAVLDADVLFQAAPARLLLSAAQSGLYRARWSERILSEVRYEPDGQGPFRRPAGIRGEHRPRS
jgi:hypothetical protein